MEPTIDILKLKLPARIVEKDIITLTKLSGYGSVELDGKAVRRYSLYLF